MATCGHDLGAAVEHRLRISGGDHHLLREADVTPPRATLVWERLPCYVPLDLVRAPLVLQLPNVLRQRGCRSAAGLAERSSVLVEAGLERPLLQPVVELGWLGRAGDLGLVHNTLCKASSA